MKGTPLALASLGLLATLVAGPTAALAQAARGTAPNSLWHEAPAARAALATSVWAGRLSTYRAIAPDLAALRATLAAAPLEGTGGGVVLTLPTPDGGSARFRIVEAPVMEAALAAQFPDIKTYAGIGLDDPTATLRADLTPRGFHAQVLSRQPGGSFYLDPVNAAAPAQGLVCYYRRDLQPKPSDLTRGACQVVTAPGGEWLGQPAGALRAAQAASQGATANRTQTAIGTTLRTYRLALAATGEYTAFTGGTVSSALSAMTTSINRVTGVYEKELGVRLVLIANTSSLIYTNASTDPYTNSDGATMLTQNQSTINSVIGSANYDIGHVFSTGGGGIAGLGVVCGTSKAEGVTGSSSPVGDPYDIDYVAHEMGHQFGGNHPFNGSVGSCTGANRNASTAWEPGSGSTIMAYAGICDGSALGSISGGTSQDLQWHSDPYFHGGNLSEMTTFINSTTCAVAASSGNTVPTVSTPANKSVPASTPLYLTGSATDADGDALTYDWEEMDLGAQGAPITPTSTQTANLTPPLFRSWNPTTDPVRYFPRLNELRNNTVVYGEALPKVARSLKFRLTVRDQHYSTALGRIVGGINQSNTVTLTVVNTGAAFAVTAPNTAVSLTGGAATTVTWNVAGTSATPISCATVNIKLSTDGGLTFPTTLASGVANSGSASVTLPNVASTTARIMVQAADNYFFDISNANFTISTGTPAAPSISSFSPTSGPVGTSVTITGTNFTGATSVKFNGTTASYTVASATSITATVPTGATTGTVSVTTSGGTANSASSFTVTTGSGTTATIVNYDFNAGTTYATLAPVTASGVTATASSTEAFITYTGTATGTGSFTTNATAGNALAMANSSGTNTKYFQFALGGSSLATYSGYKLYLQPQRSSTGAATLTLAYSTNGTTFTNVSGTATVGTAFSGFTWDLSGLTTLNNQGTVVFRLLASGASGTGTLRIDNFQVQATTTARPAARPGQTAAALTSLTLWPNPAHGTVQVAGAEAGRVLTVYSLTGRAVLTATADETGAATLPLTALPAGVYVVRAGASTQRLVVE